MKANELRIGNFVKCSITGLIDECDSDYLHDLYGGGISIEDIEPIPITEEWLLKFGFEFYNPKSKNKCYQLKKGSHKTKDFTVFSLFPYEYSFDNGYVINGSQSYIPIKFVHQLQNLYFALTGTELSPN